tara:strand:- start:3334 stop:4479 length:1146 start_codon:yes stop_codon:yes gene_type:complete
MLKSICPTIALSLLVSWPVQADLSYAQRVTVEASGGMSMFASKGTVLTQIAGDKARIENDIQLSSSLARAFAGSGKSAAIVRLDKNLLWNLEVDKQQYSEQSMAELRAQREQAMQAMQSQPGGAGLPVSAQGCQWGDSEIEFERPGDKEKIAGIKASKNIVRMHQSCRDAQTGNTCEMTWVMESWLARNVPGQREADDFRSAWARALGINEAIPALDGPAAGLLHMFANNWEEVAGELEAMRGYPLRTILEMEIGGEQCKTAAGTAIAMDEMWSDASTAAYNAALSRSGSEASSAIGSAAADSLGNSVAGSIGGAAVGAATSELIGGLTGMFKKKKEAPKPQPASASPRVSVFKISSEITSWNDNSIPKERFQEPAQWTRL